MTDAGSTHEGELHSAGLTDFSRRAKPKRSLREFGTIGLVILTLGVTGCSTPGPIHAYLYFPAQEAVLHDINPLNRGPEANIPAFLKKGEHVSALAYEPYTDHLYIRISPGNHVRVVDRPARKIKREVTVPRMPAGGHDFAIRSRDRHFFFSVPNSPALLEADLEGKFKSNIPLEGLERPVWGVALDKTTGEILLLADEYTNLVRRHGLDGKFHSELKLEKTVRGLSLDYDSEARLYYACLADGSAIGIFDDQGHLLRTLACNAASRETFIAVGPRSLLRLF